MTTLMSAVGLAVGIALVVSALAGLAVVCGAIPDALRAVPFRAREALARLRDVLRRPPVA